MLVFHRKDTTSMIPLSQAQPKAKRMTTQRQRVNAVEQPIMDLFSVFGNAGKTTSLTEK